MSKFLQSTLKNSRLNFKNLLSIRDSEKVQINSLRFLKFKQKEKLVFTWKALGISSLIAVTYFGGIYYLKKSKELDWEQQRYRSLGKAAVGGAFELIDSNNKIVTNKDFLGKWVLIYFGFTHCPDICPEELDKMIEAYEKVKKLNKKIDLVPVFISIDPERDTPEMVKKYLEEFSPDLIGLTGTKEQIKTVSKNYRVYYSPGPKTPDKDYIVDHTIIMYLINPDGEFVDYFGQTKTAENIANAIVLKSKTYQKLKKSSWI